MMDLVQIFSDIVSEGLLRAFNISSNIRISLNQTSTFSRQASFLFLDWVLKFFSYFVSWEFSDRLILCEILLDDRIWGKYLWLELTITVQSK